MFRLYGSVEYAGGASPRGDRAPSCEGATKELNDVPLPLVWMGGGRDDDDDDMGAAGGDVVVVGSWIIVDAGDFLADGFGKGAGLMIGCWIMVDAGDFFGGFLLG